MKHFKTVLGFHLKEGFSAKSFQITAFILFAAILGFFALTHYTKDSGKSEIYVDNTSLHYNIELDALNDMQDSFELKDIGKNSQGSIKNGIESGDHDGLLVISEGENGLPTVDYYYRTLPDVEMIPFVKGYLQTQYVAFVAHNEQISPEVAENLLKEVSFNQVIMDENESVGLVYFFIFVIYFFVIMYGQNVSMGIIGEKSTRVMEIMITKVKPITMMYAKIISSLLIGLSQISVIILAYFASILLGWSNKEISLFGMPIDLEVLDFNVLLLFILYFTLGYLLYALLFAAISSAISRIEELGSVIFPVSMLLMGAMFIGIRAMFNPNDTLVLISSYFPFFSPIVSFSRYILGETTSLEILLSLVILVVTVVLISLFANRVYQNGVNRYSGKASLKDVFKLAKKQK